MGIFGRLFKGKRINDGLNTPTKIYLESYGLRGVEVHFKRGYVEAGKMLEDLGKTS